MRSKDDVVRQIKRFTQIRTSNNITAATVWRGPQTIPQN